MWVNVEWWKKEEALKVRKTKWIVLMALSFFFGGAQPQESIYLFCQKVDMRALLSFGLAYWRLAFNSGRKVR